MRTLAKLVIDYYPYSVVMSNKRRPKYFKEEDVLNKETGRYPNMEYHLRLGNFKIVNGFILNEEGNKIIKNGNQLGQPVVKSINGQRLHDLRMQPHERSKIMTTIRNFILPIIKNQTKELKALVSADFPIKIIMVYFTPANMIGDLDNYKSFYEKVVLDLLRKTGVDIIPDDSVAYVNAIESKWFEYEHHKLVIHLEKYEDYELEEQKYYYETENSNIKALF